MSFVHPVLLGGLLLVGVPVLIHLIMQQKPKHLLFPAFRFLIQKHRTNQRRLRLRHLLLLALRVLLIAAICLALARPKLFSNRLGIGSDRPVAAVLVFDTSLSMGYQVSQQTRLDEAKRRALELLEVLPAESRIAVLDSAEPGGEWLNTRAAAEDRIAGLKLQAVNKPVTRQMGQAYRLLKELEKEQSDQNEAMPHFLYVFSDRTAACWDAGEAKTLKPPEGLNSVFVDVGVNDPADLAIVSVELPQQVVHPGFKATLRATIRATGGEGVNDLICLLENERGGEKRPVQLGAGQSVVSDIKRITAAPNTPDAPPEALRPGFHQFRLRFANSDALGFNNEAYATIHVQEGRNILLVTDHPGKRPEEGDAGLWFRALNVSRLFAAKVVATEEADGLGMTDLNEYHAVCLIDVAKPSPQLWDKLQNYVQGGKGLAVVLGGKDWLPSLDSYNKEGRPVLGAKLDQAQDMQGARGSLWRELPLFGDPEPDKAALPPLIRYFRDERDQGEGVRFTNETMPRARHYWQLTPETGKAQTLASFADETNSPALLENRLGKGRVLILTSALDGHLVKNLAANNYFESWFAFGLMLKTTGYLAGDAEMPNFNFLCGQPVAIAVPASPAPLLRVFGPGMGGVDVPRAKGESELRIPQATQPGNYVVYDPTRPEGRQRVAAFSLNVPEEESRLDRVPVEQVEALLGPGSVLTVERGANLADAIQGHWLQPLELFPWLMILVLLVLAVENLLANKFYRKGKQEEPASAKPQALLENKPQPAFAGMVEKEAV